MTRAEAKAAGLKRYFTGKPCKHGHISERRTRDGTCLQCGAMWIAKYREERPQYKEKAKKQTLIANRKRYADDPEYRQQKAIRDRSYAPERSIRRIAQYEKRSDIRAQKAAKHAERWANDPNYVERLAQARKQAVAKRQATRAAKILTETLGIPHTVVRMDDGTFQPVPL